MEPVPRFNLISRARHVIAESEFKVLGKGRFVGRPCSDGPVAANKTHGVTSLIAFVVSLFCVEVAGDD